MKQGTIEKILLNIEKHVDQMMKAFGKLNESEMKAIGNFVKLSEKIIETNNQLEMTNKEWNARRWITKEEGKTRIESLNISKEINRERIFGKRLLEREHRDNVQSNIKLRESFKQMDVTMGRVTKMFGGVNPMQVASMGVGAGIGMTRARMQHTDLKNQYDKVNTELFQMYDDGVHNTPKGAQDAELLRSDLRGIIKNLDNLKETKAFQVGQNPIFQAITKQLEKVGNFMAKHSTGVIISVVSLGLLIGLFKAALSVSPMLQKMLELMTMTFGLILRPFGDFFGFVLRPIAMMFLSTILPFFKTMYPRMMQLGDQIGNSLLPLVEKIFGVLNLILAALDYATDPENQESLSSAGTTLAVGLGATGGALAGRRIFNAIQNAKLHGGHIQKGSLMPNFRNIFSQQGVKDALKNMKSQKGLGYAGVIATLFATALQLILGGAEKNSLEDMTEEEGGEHNARLITDPSYRLTNDLTGNSHMNNFYGDMIFYENVDSEKTLEQINDGMKTEGDTQLGG